MPAYLREIGKPRCRDCGKPATVEVMNHLNARLGSFCAKCGAKAVEAYNRMLRETSS